MRKLILPFALVLPGIVLGMLTGQLLDSIQQKVAGLISVILLTAGLIVLVNISGRLTVRQKAVGLVFMACLNFSLAVYWLVLAIGKIDTVVHLAFVVILAAAGGFAAYIARYHWQISEGDKNDAKN